MKLKMTFAQLKKVLQTQKPKFPITILMASIEKEELEELVEILKKKS